MGKLTEQPLAELIREISIKALSGTLRLEYERMQTAVYFDKGQLIYAASNLRTLRLREYLVKRGLVSEKDQGKLANGLPDLKLAEALAKDGTLRRADIDALLVLLVSDILRVSLLWTEGTWDFDGRARLADPLCRPAASAGRFGARRTGGAGDRGFDPLRRQCRRRRRGGAADRIDRPGLRRSGRQARGDRAAPGRRAQGVDGR